MGLGIRQQSDDPEPEWAHLRIQPADEALPADRITTAFEHLHALGVPVEWLLVSTADEPLTYYVGTHAGRLSRFERICRSLFPSEYDLRRADPELPETFAEPDGEDADPPDVDALEVHGSAARSGDWQTRLRPAVTADRELRELPLAHLAATMVAHDGPVVYQALCQPKSDWSVEAMVRRRQLNDDRDTPAQRTIGAWIEDTSAATPRQPTTDRRGGQPTKEITTSDPGHRERIAMIDEKRAETSFAVNVRVVASAPAPLEDLASAFASANGPYYHLTPVPKRGDDARQTLTALRDRTHRTAPSRPKRLLQRLPLTANRSPALVVDGTTAPNVCLLSGANLSPDAHRDLAPTPGERTAITRPPGTQLDAYSEAGMLLGTPLTADGEPAGESIALPPELQPLHLAWFGKTGSGKSTALVNAILANHAATDGADILIDPKGDGMPTEYLRAHYAAHGDLDDVYYFDCAAVLPALSFFDIRDELAAGIDRTTAVEDVVDHYIEILAGIMGPDRFYRAVRSPDIIRYLVKALFDPVHGTEAFSYRELQYNVRRMHELRDAPPVTNPELEAMLGGVAANSERSFHELMQGVANRIEKIPVDDRLAQLFNHVPEGDDPHFDFLEVLDEDAVVIFDTGGLRAPSRRALTLVMLSQLWTALRRRAQLGDADEPPLVNVYLEEAAEVATSGLMTELLAQSRGFGLSVTLAMQFPAQLREADSEAYAELLNNVSTIVTGNVAVDRDLTMRLAHDDMAPAAVGNRLRALERGQWLASLPAAFGEPEPRPFVLESAPLPPGHPDGAEPLSDASQVAFDAMCEAVADRTRLAAGIDVAIPVEQRTPTRPPDDPAEEGNRVDSTLPYTKRLPGIVDYDEGAHALACIRCETRYAATAEGLGTAIECCHALADIDRDAFPTCAVELTLSASERRQSGYTDRQLMFCQIVYNAHQGRYDPELEYDIVRDSMVRLQEYVGIDADAVDDLVADDLLSIDGNQPHRLYTVTPEGREVIQAGHREGVAYGHGQGDLSESSLHVLMVELGRRYIEQAFVDDPLSTATEAVVYHEVGDHRFDAVGLDDDGEIVVACEAERSNHDTLRAVPSDFDKMAAHEPDDAIWIVPNREVAHDILRVLNDPPEGEARVEKTYSANSPPQKFTIDTPGLTEIHTLLYVRDTLLE